MVDGSRFCVKRLGVSAWRRLCLLLLPFAHAGSESNAGGLVLRLLVARGREWCLATAYSLPRAVAFNCEARTVLAGIEPIIHNLLIVNVRMIMSETVFGLPYIFVCAYMYFVVLTSVRVFECSFI